MSHNMYYTKFPVPRAENTIDTMFAYCEYHSDVTISRVTKYEKDNMWWYCFESSDGLVLNSIAFNSSRNMAASLRSDMRTLGFYPTHRWICVRKIRGCENV